jgi:hypothetical protein
LEQFDTRLKYFAKLWALATLFHQAKPVTWVSSKPEIALTFAAFFILTARVTPFRFTVFWHCK